LRHKPVEATVCFSGTEPVHTARASLARDENIATIEGLSPPLAMSSLTIRRAAADTTNTHRISDTVK
jgi:hypothetical protein